jgi:hypothetical protein
MAVGFGFSLASSLFTDFGRVNQGKPIYFANRIREKWEQQRYKSGITGAPLRTARA